MDEVIIWDSWLVVDMSKVVGGVRYKRLQRQNRSIGKAQVIREDRHKIVENADLSHEMSQLLSRALWMYRKHCARVTFGWVASDDALRCLMDEAAALRAEAEWTNKRATKAGSEQRIDIGYVASAICSSSPGVRRELIFSVRQGVLRLLEALKQEDLVKYRSAATRIRNYDKLLVGDVAIRLNAALAQLDDLKQRVRADEPVRMVDIEAVLNYLPEE